MNEAARTERVLRELAPQALGAVVRRYGNFADAEDAVQEALIAAAATWPSGGEPDHPLGWLIRVASRRLMNQYRGNDARRRREVLAASWSLAQPDPIPESDDTLILMFMCCHPSLAQSSAIPLTLRAVGGLTTREIATAFLVPEATMAQRISRAKKAIKESAEPFTLPNADAYDARLRSVLHVLYLVFNEGYASSTGPDLARAELSSEAIRLARMLREALPDDGEVTGLLALMLLTDARRPARTRADGSLVPLAEQDRALWNRELIAEGVALITDALKRGNIGEYQAQAAIAAVHDQAKDFDDTNWSEILGLYNLLARMTGNPMVTLNRAVATGMAVGPNEGLALLDSVAGRLGQHHRFHAVRAHLLERAGDCPSAIAEFRIAAATTTNLRERNYLIAKVAELGAIDRDPPRASSE